MKLDIKDFIKRGIVIPLAIGIVAGIITERYISSLVLVFTVSWITYFTANKKSK